MSALSFIQPANMTLFHFVDDWSQMTWIRLIRGLFKLIKMSSKLKMVTFKVHNISCFLCWMDERCVHMQELPHFKKILYELSTWPLAHAPTTSLQLIMNWYTSSETRNYHKQTYLTFIHIKTLNYFASRRLQFMVDLTSKLTINNSNGTG